MSNTPLFDPAEFRLPLGVVHVCAGGETACLIRHDDAMLRYLRDKSLGMPGRVAQEAQIRRTREAIARLWGVSVDEIGFVSNVAEGVSIVAESLDWRDGDNIRIDPIEYPSMVGPFALRGIEVNTGAINARTRIVSVSAVSYRSGERADLASLREQADAVGALLVVDFTQASGYMPIEASVADFAFSASYKFMLGITGVATAFWNRTRQPHWLARSGGGHSWALNGQSYDPMPAVKPDAMSFMRGNPAHASVYVLAEALDYLAGFDPLAVQAHVQGLTTALMDRLAALQIPVMTPRDPARHGASVCVASPRAQAIVDELYALGIYAWNGQGRIRFSFHGYNAMADVDRIAEAMQRLW